MENRSPHMLKPLYVRGTTDPSSTQVSLVSAPMRNHQQQPYYKDALSDFHSPAASPRHPTSLSPVVNNTHSSVMRDRTNCHNNQQIHSPNTFAVH